MRWQHYLVSLWYCTGQVNSFSFWSGHRLVLVWSSPPSAAVRPGTQQLARRTNITGRAPPPPPFLAMPGTPAVPLSRWLRLFENFLLASGANELPPARRQALLLHCLGPEDSIFDALPQPAPSPTAAIAADEAGKAASQTG
ncbi:hypothetical protein HPB47_017451 [Ixodes persulcatus]|uniref:Uncharacterized protein n=1 Tax=Ixodes persulcatus TaxID=34615 RepID=A0AC60QP61_IXOPE|nr:hypothetical protein HPB47_017451 [Ixodes persulcatus]